MPDVTIQISLGGAAAAVTSSGAVVTSQGGAEAPPPMPLEQLQLGYAASAAPPPKPPEELSRISVGEEVRATSTGVAPPPMEIAQLLSTSVGTAPTPQDIGVPAFEAGPPAPRPLEELGSMAESLPKPMPLEQLESPTPPYEREGGGETGPAPGGSRRRERSG